MTDRSSRRSAEAPREPFSVKRTADRTEEDSELLTALRANQALIQEIGLRYNVPLNIERPKDMPPVETAEEVWDLVGPEMGPMAQEQMRVLLVSTWNRLIAQRVIYVGSVHTTQVRIAEILSPAVAAGVPKIIVVHNHPGGRTLPSDSDMRLTENLEEASQLMDIEFVDHVIITEDAYTSMRENDLIGEKKPAGRFRPRGRRGPGNLRTDPREGWIER